MVANILWSQKATNLKTFADIQGSFIDWTERRGSVAFDQPQTIRRFSLKRPEPTKNQLAALEALAAKANLQSTFVTEEDEEEEA